MKQNRKHNSSLVICDTFVFLCVHVLGHTVKFISENVSHVKKFESHCKVVYLGQIYYIHLVIRGVLGEIKLNQRKNPPF